MVVLKSSLGQTPTAGPIMHYKLNDDEADTVIIDSSSNANHGVCSTNTENISTTGKINETLDLAETYNINADRSIVANVCSGDCAFAFWINSAVSTSTYPKLITCGGYAENGWVIETNQNGLNIQLEWANDSGWEKLYGNISITPGTWTHIAFVISGTTLYRYKNGEFISSETTSEFTFTPTTSSNYIVGGYTAQKNMSLLDDIRIYNRAVSPTEIGNIYKYGNGTESTQVNDNIRQEIKAENNSFIYKSDLGETLIDNLPIAHWKMNGDSTDNVGGFNGIDTNMVYVPGLIGSAGSYGATSSLITIPADEALNLKENMSVSLWFYPSGLPTPTYNYVIRNQGATWDAGVKFFMIHETNGRISWSIVPSGANLITPEYNAYYRNFASTTLNIGSWNHIACTYNGNTGSSNVYYDGVSVSPKLYTPLPIIDLNVPIQIGGDGSNVQHIDGMVDDVRYYDKELSQKEINFIYNYGNGTESEQTNTNIRQTLKAQANSIILKSSNSLNIELKEA